MIREFWKLYDARGAWLGVVKEFHVAELLVKQYPGSFYMKVLVEDKTWEALAVNLLS